MKNVLLKCEIVSDTHIDIKHPVPAVPMRLLQAALRDCRLLNADAFIIDGDTTSRGSQKNWEMTREVFSRVERPAKDILIPIGNHDTWCDEDERTAFDRYLDNTSKITGVKRTKTYFSAELNSFPFIFLGSEKDAGCEAVFSDEQLKWFEDEVDRSDEKKPLFVFCHQPLNGSHGLPMTACKDGKPDDDPMEGGVGPQSEELERILRKRKNVFYFSGHSHMGLSGYNYLKREGYSSVMTVDGLHLVNLPSLSCGNHHGQVNTLGMGLVMEIYEDRVVLRPRDCKLHIYMKSLIFDDGHWYCEKEIER